LVVFEGIVMDVFKFITQQDILCKTQKFENVCW